jgi:hypothetical protein
MTVIDVQARQALATILMPGRLGFAQPGGSGEVFVNIVNRDSVARLDAAAIAALLRGQKQRRLLPSIGAVGSHTKCASSISQAVALSLEAWPSTANISASSPPAAT